MNEAKIRLSKKETELVTNTGWILTKNVILKKINSLLENLISEQQGILHSYKSVIPDEVLATSPKISKGENYHGLPWRILDYPRLFNKENIFAIRSLFWWGNFFSVTIHISGIYKEQFETSIIADFRKLKEQNIYCCINDDPWEHHFEKNNYASLNSWIKKDFKKFVQEKEFIKLSAKIPLEPWDNIPEALLSNFSLFAGIVTGKH